MPDRSNRPDDPELRDVFFHLAGRINELLFRVFALQTLLQQQGILAKNDVEQRVEELRAVWSASMERQQIEYLEKTTQQMNEDVRRLLARFEGTKQ